MGALMVGLYTWRVEPHWLEFTHPVLPIAGLPGELEDAQLAQLSDCTLVPRWTMTTSLNPSAKYSGWL